MIMSLRKMLLIVLCIFMAKGEISAQQPSFAASELFEMAPPNIAVSAPLFKDTTVVTLGMKFPNSEIRYTLDGTIVTSKAKLYSEPITLTESAQLKAKVFHPNFKNSTVRKAAVIKIRHDISGASVSLYQEPHSAYLGAGSSGLVDLQKGGLAFKDNSQWMGFKTDSLTIRLDFERPLELSSLRVGCLINQGAWIFAPYRITVFSGKTKIGDFRNKKAGIGQDNREEFLKVSFPKSSYTKLIIVIHPLVEIPEWHQGASSKPWLFLDEILVN
ncbi:MAG: hypothetical protein COA50_01455 [Flavobacteriaceae bacterium]|nr:MAG: hypothetical protein COA50_01455 [Flavobacteriaceae bacterium]